MDSNKVNWCSKVNLSENNLDRDDFYSLFDNAGDAMIIHEIETGKVVDINKKALELYGCAKDDLKNDIGRTCLDKKPYTIERALRLIKEAAEKTLVFEWLGKKWDGRPLWVEINLKKIMISGNYYILAIVREITEKKNAEEKLKQAEEKFRTLAEEFPNIIFINKDGLVVYANKMAEKVTGYSKEELYSPKFNFLTLISPEDQPKVKEQFIKHMSGNETAPYEYKLVTKHGQKIEVMQNSKPFQYEGKNAILGIVTDLSEIRELEKERKLLSDKIVKLTKTDTLTEYEKKVLYGLVKYPELNDSQLSEALNLNRSTLTSIKNKLKKENFYSTYALPNFSLLGCDLAFFIHGLNKKTGMIEEGIKIFKRCPEVVYYLETEEEFLAFVVCQDFARSKIILNNLNVSYEKNGFSAPKTIFFPFSISRFFRFLDYSAFLEKLFFINESLPAEKLSAENISAFSRASSGFVFGKSGFGLNDHDNNEKAVYSQIINDIDINDVDISAKTDISRPTVRKFRRKFFQESLIKIINIPNIKKINCELLVYSEQKIDLTNYPSNIQIEEIIPKDSSEIISNLSLAVFNGFELVTLFAFEDYIDYKRKSGLFADFLKQEIAFSKPEVTTIFSEHIVEEKINFYSLVEQLLKR